jgi:glycine/D-amino acid oxidase-like deaminating enzyme
MNEVVFWQREREALEPISPVDQTFPDEVDVAVIGAGVTGLAAARNLARGGASVAVFDTHHVGWGASGRNGGMVSVGSKRPMSSWIKAYGRDFARHLYQASVDAVLFVEEVIKEEAIDCAYVRCGLLQAAWKPEHFGVLAAKQRFLKEEAEWDTTLVPPVDLDDELGTRGYHGGLVDDMAGRLDPFLYTRGLAAAAAKAGATIHEEAEVIDLVPIADGHDVITRKGGVKAKEVLVATNAYSGPLTPGLRRRVIPIASQIIVTEQLDEDLAVGLIPKNRIVFDTKKMLFYYRRTDDDRMFFGGRATFTAVSPQKSGQILRDKMVKLYPQLADAKVEYTWDGYVAFTFDWDPHMGRMDGLYYSMGYCGHGIALGSYMGDRIGNVIAGRPEECPFLDLSFPSNPAYRGRPWFVPLMGGYYRAYDRVK